MHCNFSNFTTVVLRKILKPKIFCFVPMYREEDSTKGRFVYTGTHRWHVMKQKRENFVEMSTREQIQQV